MRAAIAVLIALALPPAVPVLAQPPPSQPDPDDPEATLVSALIISARTPGPAWWKVTRGESTAWILGMPVAPTPTKGEWNTSVLERRLDAARAVLMVPLAQVRVPGSAGKSLGWLDQARSAGGDMADLARRFEAARKRLKQPDYRYKNSAPYYAVLRMTYDFDRSIGMHGEAGDQIAAMAQARKIPVRRPPPYPVARMSQAEMNLAYPGMTPCFTAMLEHVERGEGAYANAAHAWAAGDVAGALAMPRDPLSLCVNSLNPGAARNAIDAQAAAIKAALMEPGSVVVLAPLRQILAVDGLVSRLVADGYAVTGPNLN